MSLEVARAAAAAIIPANDEDELGQQRVMT